MATVPTPRFRETESNGYEILSNGIAVWVNGPDGCCAGRFSLKYGIDIHRSAAEQAKGGECLYCTHEPAGAEEWKVFVTKISEFFGVTIDPKHCPRELQTEKP